MADAMLRLHPCSCWTRSRSYPLPSDSYVSGRWMRISGSCHCGNIAFEAEGEFDKAMECNCSFCRRRGVLLAFVPRDKLELTTPRENLSTYHFNKEVIAHHF